MNEEKIYKTPPVEGYQMFKDTEEMIEKTREWGINSQTGVKETFWYKKKNNKIEVKIVGLQKIGISEQVEIAVIEFPSGDESCILPAYLKEMQSNKFGKEEVSEQDEEVKEKKEPKKSKKEKTVVNKKEKAEKKPKENKQVELDLKVDMEDFKNKVPTEKVKLEFVVERFDTLYNPFNDKEDPVMILKDVRIEDNDFEIEKLWCSVSKTIEKHGIEEGQKISCEGKIVLKNYKKEVQYKLNNPSKINLI